MSRKDSILQSKETLIPFESFNRTEVNSNRAEPDFEFECHFCKQLWQYSYPTILLFGLVGNALCLLAYKAHKLRRETRLLCSFRAVLDVLSLNAAFASRWPDAAFGTDIMSLHPALCHLLLVANYWLPEFAAWALVYLSIERFLSGEIFINNTR